MEKKPQYDYYMYPLLVVNALSFTISDIFSINEEKLESIQEYLAGHVPMSSVTSPDRGNVPPKKQNKQSSKVRPLAALPGKVSLCHPEKQSKQSSKVRPLAARPT